MNQHFTRFSHRAGQLILGVALLVVLLAGCRASGPGTPARTVAAFFSKYEKRSGFHTTEWSAGLLQRLALVKIGNLLGGTDLTNALTGIRAARVLSFAPTSSSAQSLVKQGLVEEATNLLQAEKYTPFVAGTSTATSYSSVIKTTGDRVSELVATGALPSVTGSFVLVQIEGNFTRAQADALARVLPTVVQQTAK